jgi:hypothetical protein
MSQKSQVVQDARLQDGKSDDEGGFQFRSHVEKHDGSDNK